MASETPRIDPCEVAQTQSPVFRLIAQVKSQPNESSLILSSPTEGNEMITLSDIKVSLNKQFDVDSWHEFICRSSDTGEMGFLVLDSVPCVLKDGEQISVDGIVTLQRLAKQFPEIF